MNLFSAWSPLFFATFVSVSAGWAAIPDLIPVTDPNQRLEFEGFSILPPKGENWFMAPPELLRGQDVKKAAEFVKMFTPPSVTHTIVARVTAAKIPVPSKSRVELLQDIAQAKKQDMSTGRHRLITIKTALDKSLGSDCLRYDVTAEDRGALMYPGSVYIVDIHGFTCFHPDSTSYLIQAEYSQRRLQEEAPLSLEAEGEAFLKDLVFRTFPPPAGAKPTAPTQDASKLSGSELGSDRTWKHLPVYSPTLGEKSSDRVLTYVVDTTVEALEQYYLPRLERNGWKVTKREAFETTKFGGPALHLNVEGEKRNASIWISERPRENFTLVMLACWGEDHRSACEDN